MFAASVGDGGGASVGVDIGVGVCRVVVFFGVYFVLPDLCYVEINRGYPTQHRRQDVTRVS